MKSSKTVDKNQEIGGFLKGVERIGNALPHPAILFLILAMIVVVVSALAKGASVTYFDAKAGEEVTKEVISLMNADGIRYMFGSAVKNFTGFAPLGTVLVGMLGVAVADHGGLIPAALKKLLASVDTRLLTPVVVFAGIMSNIASDAGYVVVIPLGAVMFAAAGKHPLAGLAAAFAGVSGGFSANLALGTIDPMLADITNASLEAVGIDYSLAATANYYFMIVSTFVLTIVGTIITNRLEKRLGHYTGDFEPDKAPLTEVQNKGLRNALIAMIIFFVVMAFLMVPENAILRQENKYGVMALDAFMHDGLIPAILLGFLIPGLAYGMTVGTIKSTEDLIKLMGKGMAGLSGYLVLAFFASQFVSYFGKTNLATIVAYRGAEVLKAAGISGLPLIIAFIFVSAFLNLFMGSASAKWAIMAPVFVPMMYELGLSPEVVQTAYRIGDSSTNLITPLMSYFAMIVVFMKKYDEKSGLGTLISMMLPYSMAFLVVWSIMMAVWYFIGLPVGPGAYIHIM